MENKPNKSVRRYDGNGCFTFINCSFGAVVRYWIMTKLCGGSNIGMVDDKGGLMKDALNQGNIFLRAFKGILALLVIYFVVSMFTGCATQNESVSPGTTSSFSEGYKQGYASIDPICENTCFFCTDWLKRCPEDGGDPYWSWKRKPEVEAVDPIIRDKVIPTTHDEEKSDG